MKVILNLFFGAILCVGIAMVNAHTAWQYAWGTVLWVIMSFILFAINQDSGGKKK